MDTQLLLPPGLPARWTLPRGISATTRAVMRRERASTSIHCPSDGIVHLFVQSRLLTDREVIVGDYFTLTDRETRKAKTPAWPSAT